MPSIDSAVKPKLKAPPGTCDTHMHIYDPKYPKAPTAKIDAPAAPVSAYRKMCAADRHRADCGGAALDLR